MVRDPLSNIANRLGDPPSIMTFKSRIRPLLSLVERFSKPHQFQRRTLKKIVGKTTTRRHMWKSLVSGAVLLFTVCPLYTLVEYSDSHEKLGLILFNVVDIAATQATLIVYVVAEDGDTAEENLEYFLRHGVSRRRSYKYFFVVQEGFDINRILFRLPPLPRNVQIVSHVNECFDVGTVGWLLFSSDLVKTEDFSYFLWLNPSVRGPFVPTWINSREWPLLFTTKLSRTTKLSGTVLNCGGIVDERLGTRVNPHLQSYLLATDRIGLQILKNANVFHCYRRYTEVIYFGEVGASLAILEAGYNIHSSMIRYKNVDWRVLQNWDCNRRAAPIIPDYNDGISLDPLEVTFVKVKRKQLAWESTKRALKYTKMQEPLSVRCTSCNEAIDDIEAVSKLKEKLFRLRKYFDFAYYSSESRDLRGLSTAKQWEHFESSGFHERRPFAINWKNATKKFPVGADSTDRVLDSILWLKNQVAVQSINRHRGRK